MISTTSLQHKSEFSDQDIYTSPINPILSSLSDEWYTPQDIIEAARGLMGSIDLDPASDAIAQKNVKARLYFNKEQRSLEQSWHGNVFLNPPGGKEGNKSISKMFWEKLLHEYKQGRVNQAVFIVFNLNSGIAINSSMAEFPTCFTNNESKSTSINGSGRIRFIKDGASAPTHANAIIYLPPHSSQGNIPKRYLIEFANQFGKFGRIMLPYSLY